MALMKSLLLGSAAALVVVAGAQAADLPTKKGAPAAEYVKVCKIDGMAGFVIPGSDTCLKISGYLTAQVTAGNLSKQYNWVGTAEDALAPGAPTNARSDIGYTTRWNLAFDAKNNTAYGVLSSHVEMQFEYANGFDPTANGSAAYLNTAYLNWAGITAGKAKSFFTFPGFAGGEGWANLFSPDQQGYNQPLLLAYTATFGGGFSATISLQDPVLGGGSGPGVDEVVPGDTYQGVRYPDIVAAIDLTQSWGTAHVAGVAHNVNVLSFDGVDTQNTWGWAIDGGVKFNLPMIGAGDEVQIQGSWAQNATWYSGLPGAMWDEGWNATNGGIGGGVNGNGVASPFADTYSEGGAVWATPTAWSIAASGEFHFSPVFFIAPEIGYGQLHWSGDKFGNLSDSVSSWMGGAVFHWDPVAHLDFNLELLYQSTTQSKPTGWVGSVAVPNWQSTSSGLEGRFEITRDF